MTQEPLNYPKWPRESAAAFDEVHALGAGRLVEETRARLRPACRDMAPEQFDALISDIVRFRLRWDPAWRGARPEG
jgi:hypothetical protein